MDLILPSTYSIEEQAEIQRQYQVLIASGKLCKSPQDIEQVTQALVLAADAHKKARRESGEPYICHPIAVALILANEMGLGKISIISALLHDVVEDTEHTLDEIREVYGEKVAKIVDGVTKLDMVDFQDDIESIQAENFRKIVTMMSDDIRVILVKLADRLHNMRTLSSMPHHKQLKIASETLFIYAPVAYRLGLYAIKMELEDISLRYINPQVYKSVSTQLANIRDNKTKEMNDFVEPLKKDFEERGMKVRIKILERTVSSVWERMQKFEQSLDEVYDVYVVRLIIDCPFEDEKIECWKAFAILTSHYRPNNAKLRDWVSYPKTNGYESIHAVFMNQEGNWVEVQIRTERMEDVAEHGFAASWWSQSNSTLNYKNSFNMWLDRVKNLVNSETSSALDFLNNFKLDLFNDEIFVFTPKGDMICLPKGSTVLDLGYTVHSELGNHCIGANVNKRLQKIDYELKMGDQVDIITSEFQNPSEKWYDYLVTSIAKSRLKAGIKDYRKSFKEKGKQMLSEMFAKLNVEFSKQNRNIVVEKEHLNSRTDLYYYVATGKIKFQDVEAVFRKDSALTNTWRRFLNFSMMRSASSAQGQPENEETNEFEYTISTCCNPIPGDEVVAITLPNEPIQIHRPDCQNAIKLMSRYGNNIIKAKWQFKDNFAFLAILKIICVNKMGLGGKLFTAITDDLKLNVQAIEMHTEGGIVETVLSVYVNNLKNLDELIERIRKIDLVKKVTRIDRLPNNR